MGHRAAPLTSVLVLGWACGVSSLLAQAGITGTKHDLSVGSGNSIRAATSTEICAFCHTPHGSMVDAPLWNRSYSTANYTPYSGASLQTVPGQPNGYSKLCLSCHDGTIAIGSVLNVPNSESGSVIATVGTDAQGRMPAGPTLLGTNLSDDHPISFPYDQPLQASDGELADPSTLTGAVKLYPGATAGIRNSVQCVTCHDPHSNAIPKFLRQSPRGRSANLCLTCHSKPGWVGSAHEASTKTVSIGGVSDQVGNHSCLSCHAPHTSTGAERLLRNGASGGQSTIEGTCYQCHTTAGVAANIQGEFGKASRHDVAAYSGSHRPVFITEPPSGLPENVQLNPGSPAPDPRFADLRHVECVDCHNPHRTTAGNLLEGMRGIDLSGAIIQNPRNDSSATGPSQQYAVCLRCHGNSYNTALPVTFGGSGLTPSNKRLEFQVTNSAFHPVGAPGRNASSNLNLQLLGGLTTNSVIKCTDCHNSNGYSSTTGKVIRTAGTPSGPHGSSNQVIFRANYRLTLNLSTYSSTNFALCWRCHSESLLFGSRSNFWDNIDGKGNLHALHIRDRIDKTGAICRSCHFNAHSNVEAPNTQYNIDGVTSLLPPGPTPTRLVNFNPVIQPIGGRIKPEWWFNTGTRERRCYLQCHTVSGGTGGEIMNGESGSGGKRARYRPASGDLP